MSKVIERLAAMLAIVLLSSLACAGAGHAQITDSCNRELSTMDVVDCLNRQTEVWDKRLNAAYRAAMNTAEPGAATVLRAAERGWLEYRKQRCAYLSHGDGSITRILWASCMFEMTKARTNELLQDAKGLGG